MNEQKEENTALYDTLIEENHDDLDSICSEVDSQLDALRALGFPQELINEAENKLIEAIAELENLRDGCYTISH